MRTLTQHITFLGRLLDPLNSQEVHRRLTGQLSHQVRSAKLGRLRSDRQQLRPQLAQSALSSKPAARPAEVQYFYSSCLKLDFSSTPLPAALRPKRSIQQIFGSWLTSAEQGGLGLGDIADQQVTW